MTPLQAAVEAAREVLRLDAQATETRRAYLAGERPNRNVLRDDVERDACNRTAAPLLARVVVSLTNAQRPDVTAIGGGLFVRDGAVAICRHCGAVHEGTASFAISHAKKCRARQIADALIREDVPPHLAVEHALLLASLTQDVTP